MLSIVQHQEETLGPEVLGQSFGQALTLLLFECENLRHGLRHEAGVRQSRQLDQPHAIAVAVDHRRSDTHGEARLADAARSRQGQ